MRDIKRDKEQRDKDRRRHLTGLWKREERQDTETEIERDMRIEDEVLRKCE